LVSDEPAPQLRVDRVDRDEEIDRRAAPGGVGHVAHEAAVVHRLGDEVLVDVDHVDALLDRGR
jgi:hypothetical protein